MTTPRLVKRGGVFQAVYAGPDGRRVRRSTGMTSEAAALARLSEWVRDAENARAGIAPAEVPRDVPSLIAGWVASMRTKGRSTGYVQRAEAIVRRAATDMGWHHVKHLTPHALVRWQERARQGGIEVSTLNMRTAVLRGWTKWVHQSGAMTHDAGRDIGPVRDATERRRRGLEASELHTLLASPLVPTERRRAYLMLFYTGLRGSELRKLPKSAVSLEKGAIFVPASITKNGDASLIPIADGLRAELEALVGDGMRIGGRLMRRVPRNKEFQSDLRAAGIEAVDPVTGRIATLHGLRRSMNTELRRAGVDTATRRVLGRWKGDTLPDDTYNDRKIEELRDALNRLPRIA